MLTERQRLFISLHFAEDLSFGEIAAEYDISRQAVHDAVKHGTEALKDYEEKLGLLHKQVNHSRGGGAAVGEETSAKSDELRSVLEDLDKIKDTLERSGGVLYNVDGVLGRTNSARSALSRILND